MNDTLNFDFIAVNEDSYHVEPSGVIHRNLIELQQDYFPINRKKQIKKDKNTIKKKNEIVLYSMDNDRFLSLLQHYPETAT